MYRVLHIPGGAGFLPSTVSSDIVYLDLGEIKGTYSHLTADPKKELFSNPGSFL